jgi:hypothetical protein
VKNDNETLTDRYLKRLKNNPFLAILIAGAVILASVIGFFGSIRDSLEKLWPSARRVDQIFVTCRWGVLPQVMPAEGHINLLYTNEIPQDSGGGGLADMSSPPGSQLKFTNDAVPAWAYRCEATNYSPAVVFNVIVPLRLTFFTAVPVPSGPNSQAFKGGAATLERDWVFTIPKLDPAPAAPFVFYVWNCCEPRFVRLRLPDRLTMQGGMQMPLVQSTGNLIQDLSPAPLKK